MPAGRWVSNIRFGFCCLVATSCYDAHPRSDDVDAATYVSSGADAGTAQQNGVDSDPHIDDRSDGRPDGVTDTGTDSGSPSPPRTSAGTSPSIGPVSWEATMVCTCNPSMPIRW